MSVGLLIITHEGIASNLLNTAKNMLGICPLATRALEVPLDTSPEEIQIMAQSYLEILDQGNGVLILTDLYGSTPCNISRQLLVNSGLLNIKTGSAVTWISRLNPILFKTSAEY